MENAVVANPGSPGWSAGGAFLGHVVGATLGGGLLGGIGIAKMATKAASSTPQNADVVKEPFKVGGLTILGSMLGGAAGSAAGAAVGAPPALRTKAATWAAVGGAVPFFGAALGPLAAWLSTRDSGGRRANMTTGTTALLAILGVVAVGGATYAGVKFLKKREEQKKLDPGKPKREPSVIPYSIDEVDGLTIDLIPGDMLVVETGAEEWQWNSELPAAYKPEAGGSIKGNDWVVTASSEYAGTWDVEMVGPQHYAEFKVKIHA